MTGDRRGDAKVRFAPFGLSVVVQRGTTVLDACSAAGILIDAVCGGEGECGRCKVIVNGEFESQDSTHITKTEAASGVVLACTTIVEGDVTVEVPERSRLKRHQILTKSVDEFPRHITPWVKKRMIELPKASVTDNVADLERLSRTLGVKKLNYSMEVLGMLPGIARGKEGRITLTISSLGHVPEVSRIESGSRGGLYGIAVDIGTTTVVVELVDLLRGKVLGISSEYNRQIEHGEDVIARMIFAEEGGLDDLARLVKDTINSNIKTVLAKADVPDEEPITEEDIVAASMAGNTVMTHFLASLPTHTIRREPYVPVAHTLPPMRADDLGIAMNPAGSVLLFPSRAGYVGGDIVADVLSSRMHRSDKVSLLIDVGTNGEVVLGCRDWLVSCACSAGPAFEGGETSCGMRAMDGAIDKIRINEDRSCSYHVIGNSAPSGVCGSGLIDLMAEMFTRGIIDRKARINDLGIDQIRETDEGRVYVIEHRERLSAGATDDLVMTDPDLQNILRTKAAIFSACSVLLRKTGVSMDNLASIIIAGGFGYNIDIDRAIILGMFPDVSRKKYRFIGNGSVAGARLALLSEKRRKEATDIFEKMTYLELSVDNDFYNEFSSSLFLPHTDLSRFPSAAPGFTEVDAR
jgi:uncharacterized 2Fe-2S/4Fe-4S cluster protein (DUF4445 family)